MRVESAANQLDGHGFVEFVVDARGGPHRAHTSAPEAALQLIGTDAIAFGVIARIGIAVGERGNVGVSQGLAGARAEEQGPS